jgi:hypothetical protein
MPGDGRLVLSEATELLSDTEKGTEVSDVAIISAAQKVEHYEIASYGTLRTLAGTLGYSEAQELFDATLAEEKNADSLLTQVAENYVNESRRTGSGVITNHKWAGTARAVPFFSAVRRSAGRQQPRSSDGSLLRKSLKILFENWLHGHG